MNYVTKIGLAVGVAALLVLGLIFRQEPGSYGAQTRAALQQSEQAAVSLRADLERANEASETLTQQLAAARDELGTLQAQAAQREAAQAATPDPHTRIATLELEVEGLRERLATSKASGAEMVASLKAQLNARALAPKVQTDTDLIGKVQGLQAQIGQAETMAAERQQQSERAIADLQAALDQSNTERDELGARLQAELDSAAQQSQALSSAREEVARLSDEASAATASLTAVNAERDELRQQLAELTQSTTESDRAAALASQLQTLQGEATTLRTQLAELTAERDGLQAGLREASQRVAGGDSSDGAAADLMAALNNQFAVAGFDGVEVYPRGGDIVSVRASNSEMFSPGGTSISSLGRAILAEVGSVVQAMPERRVQIEGHTDNIPIGAAMSGLYGSNWDLSVARAMAAVRHLERRVGIGADRLSGAGFGEFVPVASNDTAEGRSLNRRIEIVLYPTEQTPN